MTTEIRVPTLGESVSEATIGRWFKKAGDAVKADEPLCELETDKVTLEVNAPAAGVLAEIVAKDGETVEPGGLLGQISEGGAGAAQALQVSQAKIRGRKAPPPAETAKAGAGRLARRRRNLRQRHATEPKGPKPMPPAPAAAKVAADRGIDLDGVEGSGRRGQVVKGDVLTLQPAQAPRPRPRRPRRRCARPRRRPMRSARNASA